MSLVYFYLATKDLLAEHSPSWYGSFASSSFLRALHLFILRDHIKWSTHSTKVEHPQYPTAPRTAPPLLPSHTPPHPGLIFPCTLPAPPQTVCNIFSIKALLQDLLGFRFRTDPQNQSDKHPFRVRPPPTATRTPPHFLHIPRPRSPGPPNPSLAPWPALGLFQIPNNFH